MRIAIPKEAKPGERRVALTPAAAGALRHAGHEVVVQAGCGRGAGYSDEEYAAHGALVLDSARDVWSRGELIVKVKEPQPEEVAWLQPGQILFTYLHLAAWPELADALLASGVTAIGYETVQLADGSLPLLTPMSEIAGRMAVQVGAHFLESPQGGRGVLLGGVPGVPPGDVVILGAGTVGLNAARMALGLGARVLLFDINLARLRQIDERYGGRLETRHANPPALREAARQADILIGAVLVAGARAPQLIDVDTVRQMRPGSVIVDVAVDQGGCVATIDRPTTHEQPVYRRYGVLHYAVANIPGAVPRTATQALAAAVLPYVEALAGKGLPQAVREDAALARGVNVHRGSLTHPAVAASLRRPHRSLDEAGLAPS